MPAFSGAAMSAPSNTIYRPQWKVGRKPKATHVFQPTFGEARKKLGLAFKMHEWRAGAMDAASGITLKERLSGKKIWDKGKCASLLEDMGYRSGEIEFGLLQFSDRFEKTLRHAAETISALEQKYNAAKKLRGNSSDPQLIKALTSMMSDLALAANVAASAALKEEEPYILWASKAWAKTSPEKIRNIFYRLVDANSYICQASISAFYNLQYSVGGKQEYVVQKPIPALEKYYSYINMPKSLLDKKGREGRYPSLVRNYSYNLKKFNKHLSKSIDDETSWFDYHKKIAEAKAPLEKLWAAASPFVSAATPIAAALTMLSPYTCLLGYAYFTGSAAEALQRGDYWHAGLITLSMGAPIFGEMSELGTGALSTLSKAGMLAGKGAGYIFQAEMGISAGSLLIDASKYGLSLEQAKQLGEALGLIAMPFATRNLTKGGGEKSGFARKKARTGQEEARTEAPAGKKSPAPQKKRSSGSVNLYSFPGNLFDPQAWSQMSKAAKKAGEAIRKSPAFARTAKTAYEKTGYQGPGRREAARETSDYGGLYGRSGAFEGTQRGKIYVRDPWRKTIGSLTPSKEGFTFQNLYSEGVLLISPGGKAIRLNSIGKSAKIEKGTWLYRGMVGKEAYVFDGEKFSIRDVRGGSMEFIGEKSSPIATLLRIGGKEIAIDHSQEGTTIVRGGKRYKISQESQRNMMYVHDGDVVTFGGLKRYKYVFENGMFTDYAHWMRQKQKARQSGPGRARQKKNAWREYSGYKWEDFESKKTSYREKGNFKGPNFSKDAKSAGEQKSFKPAKGYVDFYKLLELPETATEGQIKSKITKMTKDYHPDISRLVKKGIIDEKFAHEMTVKLNKAREILLDPQKRESYNKTGKYK